MPPLHVAVVGAGTAGLTAAILLRRAGHRVAVHEAVQQSAPVGAGFLIQPTGAAVLEAMGLLGSARLDGAVVEGLEGRRAGVKVMELRYGDLQPDLAGLGMHRANLQRLLLEAASAEGIEVHWGAPVEQLEDSRFAAADLVLLCDGTRSRLRGQLPIHQRARPYPWGACWAICESDSWGEARTLSQRYGEPWRMIGVLPTGRHPVSGRPCYSVFNSIHEREFAAWRAEGPSRLERALAQHWPEASELWRDSPVKTWSVAEYQDVRLRQFHHGRFAVLGDGAHSMSPQLGQGVNFALLDAWVLAACVAREDRLEQALARYSRLRLRHVSFYQACSRLMTPLYQGALPLGVPRDLGTWLGRRLPFLYRQLLLLLSGWKRGPWGRYESLGEFSAEERPPRLGE